LYGALNDDPLFSKINNVCIIGIYHCHDLTSGTSQALKAKLDAEMVDVKGMLEKLVAQSL
jgi:hypothetical protein